MIFGNNETEKEDEEDFGGNDGYSTFDNYGLREKGVIGLKNLKNTCFMNSSLQCLSHIDILYTKLKDNKMKGKKLTKYFYEMINLMHETKELKFYEPKDIFKTMCDEYPKYKNYQQQDANEFITKFLSVLHKELNSKDINKKKIFDITDQEWKKAFNNFYFYKDNTSPIIDIFYGNFIHINKCKKGHVIDYEFSVYNMLELSISNLRNNNIINLESLIKENTKYGPLGINEFCFKCKKKTPSFLGIQLLNTPDILIIFINRFINNIFYNNLIDFPTTLNLEDCILEDKNLNKNFKLIGVINHSGTGHFGHYTAESKNFIDGKWYYFNDSWVSESELNKKKERYKSSKVLILFYQRFEDKEKENKKKNINVILSDDQGKDIHIKHMDINTSIIDLKEIYFNNRGLYKNVIMYNNTPVSDSQRLYDLIQINNIKDNQEIQLYFF